jgi:transcriptional regulator with XRE-family HTH domain
MPGISAPLPGLLLPRLAQVFPAPAQSDLFRSGGFSIALKELHGWSQGRVPPSIRSALDYEIRRRGILQVQLARRLGVSKQQLTNVLHGRSGASAALASGLSAFIREEAQFAQPGRQWR